VVALVAAVKHESRVRDNRDGRYLFWGFIRRGEVVATRRRALISVSDKTGLETFVRGIESLDFEIVSTGGTCGFIESLGIRVTDVAEYTGFPEMLDGRVKTLHPRVHGGLLGRPGLPTDAAAMNAHGILPFELLVCNLYPFEETVAKPGVAFAEGIEQIDIGGPGMLRSAAKNHAHVAVVCRPDQYGRVLEALQTGGVPESLRRELALAAFECTARYDRAISHWLSRSISSDGGSATEYPSNLAPRWTLRSTLRYGENPHQSAAFYVDSSTLPGTLAAADVLHGKELSYNNLLDLDAALGIVQRLGEPSACIIKHNVPCGAGVGDSAASAFQRAYEGDPVSAFGGIVGLNRTVDVATAAAMCQPGRFLEAIIAPGFDPDAFQMLTTVPKWKASVRLLSCPSLAELAPGGREFRSVSGGVLVQQRDDAVDDESQWKCVTRRQPTDSQWSDLRFAWSIVRAVKSNAIVVVNSKALVGVGGGQTSRVDAVNIAVSKAGERANGGVLASDAFFPFRDGVDAALSRGVTAVIQPGGSKNDAESIAACDERGVPMIFTGRRHFRH
jgi:phosphoribosylaminoimidazolecarboxamide formyltransferase/IMP cyclohydrolase